MLFHPTLNVLILDMLTFDIFTLAGILIIVLLILYLDVVFIEMDQDSNILHLEVHQYSYNVILRLDAVFIEMHQASYNVILHLEAVSIEMHQWYSIKLTCDIRHRSKVH